MRKKYPARLISQEAEQQLTDICKNLGYCRRNRKVCSVSRVSLENYSELELGV